MIKSMTGFGRSESITKEHKIVVEMKSVNYRYCDINIKIPKKLIFLKQASVIILRSTLEEVRWIFLLPMKIIQRTKFV